MKQNHLRASAASDRAGAQRWCVGALDARQCNAKIKKSLSPLPPLPPLPLSQRERGKCSPSPQPSPRGRGGEVRTQIAFLPWWRGRPARVHHRRERAASSCSTIPIKSEQWCSARTTEESLSPTPLPRGEGERQRRDWRYCIGLSRFCALAQATASS